MKAVHYTMHFLRQPCPFCDGQGLLGLYRGANGVIAALCDECEALFLTPANTDPEMVVPFDKSFWSVPNAGWATAEEIEAAGLTDLVAGTFRK
jgi:hypothetical protein